MDNPGEVNTARKLEMVAQGDDLLIMRRRFTASPQLVWDAHTRPELIRRWQYGPGGWSIRRAELDLRAGGSYRYEWSNEDGREVGIVGQYLEVSEPSKLVYTELFDEDWTDGEALWTRELIDEGGVTLLKSTVKFKSSRARDAFLLMEEGSEVVYQQLEDLLQDM